MSHRRNYNHRELRQLYKHVLSDLASIEIPSMEEYEYARAAGYYFPQLEKLTAIEFAFVENLSRITNKLSAQLQSSPGITMLITEHAPELTENHLKKMNLFASKSILEVDAIDPEEVTESVEEDGAESFEIKRGPDITPCLSHLFSYMADVKAGVIVPVPTEIIQIDADAAIEYREVQKLDHFAERNVNAMALGLSEDDIETLGFNGLGGLTLSKRRAGQAFLAFEAGRDEPPSIIDALYATTIQTSFPSNMFRVSLGGDTLGQHSDWLKVGLILPSLENISVGDARRLRRDHGDAFGRFQRALIKLSAGLGNIGDETRLHVVMQEIDHEVNELNLAFERIKRTHKRIKSISGLVSIMYCLLAKNPQMVDHLHSILSGIGVMAFSEYFRHSQDAKAQIESSPFYFPYMVASEGQKQGS